MVKIATKSSARPGCCLGTQRALARKKAEWLRVWPMKVGRKPRKKSVRVSSGEFHSFIYKIGERPQIILHKPPMVGSYGILSACSI